MTEKICFSKRLTLIGIFAIFMGFAVYFAGFYVNQDRKTSESQASEQKCVPLSIISDYNRAQMEPCGTMMKIDFTQPCEYKWNWYNNKAKNEYTKITDKKGYACVSYLDSEELKSEFNLPCIEYFGEGAYCNLRAINGFCGKNEERTPDKRCNGSRNYCCIPFANKITRTYKAFVSYQDTEGASKIRFSVEVPAGNDTTGFVQEKTVNGYDLHFEVNPTVYNTKQTDRICILKFLSANNEVIKQADDICKVGEIFIYTN